MAEDSPELLASLHSVPSALAFCRETADITFRSDAWRARIAPDSEQIQLVVGDHAARVHARSPQGQPLDLPATATETGTGWWLRLDQSEADSGTGIAELQLRIAELERHAYKDALTGLWNRRFFESTIGADIARATRHGLALTLLVLDVDHFKAINDTQGHATGDEALRAIAAILQSRCRQGDLVMRWGGDEFAILAEMCSWRGGQALAENLRQAVERSELAPGVHTTLSIGVGQFLPGDNYLSWFNRVDHELYNAKQGGRNTVRVHTGQPSESDDGLVHLVWRDSWTSGHPLIDDQHRSLVQLANRVLGAALPGSGREVAAERVLAELDALLRHVVQHFADEEGVLHDVGYPKVRQHAAAHVALAGKATALRLDVANGKATLGALVDFIAHDVIIRHMATADADFFPYVRLDGAAPAAGTPVK